MSRDIAGLRANRHTNADFVTALKHRVVEHAIEADTRQQQCNNCEKKRQHCQKTLADGLRLVDLLLGTDIAHTEPGPRPWHFLTQSLRERERVGAVGAYNERASPSGLVCPCSAVVN